MVGGESVQTFVARGAELAALRAALDEVRGGRPAVVSVEGDAGIGKTTLLRRFVAEISGATLLWASGDETETALEYGVMSQLWRAMPPEVPDTSSLVLRTPSPDSFAVGAAFLGALGAVQERGAAVVVVDDLQWADLASTRALLFAMRRLRRDGVLVLVSSRPRGLEGLDESLTRLIAEQGRRLRLSGLGPPDVDQLAKASYGLELSRAAQERLSEHTGGNPLYVRALLEEVPVSALADASVSLPAPHSYAATVLTKVVRLPHQSRDLLAAGSVVGFRFSLPVAAAAAQVDDAFVAFDDACGAGLLEPPVGSPAGQVQFAHPLVRAAIYDELSPARRRQLHLAVAALVDSATALKHRVAAAPGADEQLAGELAAVAERAIRAGELPNAAEYLLSAARVEPDRTRREDRLLHAIELLLLSGESVGLRYLDAARACRDGPHKTFVLSCLTATSGQFGAATAALESLLHGSELARDRALFGRAAGALALFCSMQGRLADATQWATRALEAAGDNPTVDLTARQSLASALAAAGRAPEALTLLADLSPGRLTPRPFEPELLATRGALKVGAGDFAGAVLDLSAVVRWSRAGAHLRSLPDAYAALAQAEYGLGAWDDGIAHADTAISLARDLGHPWYLTQAHKVAVDLYAARGDWDFAREHVARARRAATASDVPAELAAACVAEATLAWAQRSWRAVLEALTPLRHTPSGLPTPSFDPFSWRLHEAEALIALDRLDDAGLALDEAEAMSPPAVLSADLHRLRAGLALGRGQRAEAHARLEAGLEAAAQSSSELSHALLELAYGRFLRSSGSWRAAIPRLRTARETLSRLDATPFLAACDAELSACGITPTEDRAAGNRFGLTAKELVVARLVAQGLTNQQVAGELFVSSKAIEYHLGNIYAKAGITSRRQIFTVLAPPAPQPLSS